MRKFNLEEFIWFLVLVFINAGIIYLVKSDKVEFYIGSKMIKYMYMTIFLVFTMSVFQIANIFTPKGSGNLFGKIIPIILALIIGFISVKAQSSFRHNELYNNLINDFEESHNHNHESKLSKKEINDYIANGNIVIDDNNLEILTDMKRNPDDYIGKSMEFKGFVCRDEILGNNRFMIGRVQINCCAADSKVVGIFAEYNNADNICENDWVNIKGSISYTTVNDNGTSHRIPIVKIIKLEKLENENRK